MLWTEKYHPGDLAGIISQDQAVRYLRSFAVSGTMPHLIFSGPHGTAKSTAAGCFARALFGIDWELNTTIVPVADLFSQGKTYLEHDERYAHLFQRNLSFISNFKYIIKWYASLRPLNAEFKLMVFEDADALTRDAQQAMRRIMERASGTCRFIYSTTKPSAIIPPISSRCLQLFFAPVDMATMLSYLRGIREKERGDKLPCSDDDLELIVQISRGDLRRALLLLQVAMETGKCSDFFTVAQSETANVAGLAYSALKEGDTKNGVRRLESLIIDFGLSLPEVFSEVRRMVQREYNHPSLAVLLADAEFRSRYANNDFIRIGAFATSLSELPL